MPPDLANLQGNPVGHRRRLRLIRHERKPPATPRKPADCINGRLRLWGSLWGRYRLLPGILRRVLGDELLDSLPATPADHLPPSPVGPLEHPGGG